MDEAAFLSLGEIVAAARRALPDAVWDYLWGGADTETTLRRNRQGFDRLALKPRVLRRVDAVDCRTSFLGAELRTPVMLAPIGALALFDPEASLAAAKAADAFGTTAFIGCLGYPDLEAVAAGTGRRPIYQLYVRGDRPWLSALIARVERAGYAALCVTADTAHYGRRDRDLANRFVPATAVPRPDMAGTLGADGDRFQAEADWETLAFIRGATKLPLVLKGVMTPEDALDAVAAKVDVIYVSNHGGRQLDHAMASIEALPAIAAAVAGKARIVLDSGVLRGSDVVKALALGADAVAIGKLQATALAAGGVPALVRALELLELEIRTAMALLGARSLRDVAKDRIGVLDAAASPASPLATAFPSLEG